MPSERFEHEWDAFNQRCSVCHDKDFACPTKLREALDAAEAARDKLTHAMVGAVAKRMEAEAKLSAARREALVDAHTAIGRLPYTHHEVLSRSSVLLAIEDLIAALERALSS